MNTVPPLKKSSLPKGKTVWIIAGLLLVFGAGAASWKWISSPPKPWLVRWRVVHFLKKQVTHPDFKVDFPFPSKSEMARTPLKREPELTKGKRTGKDFDTLKTEYIRLKRSALTLEGKRDEIDEQLRDKNEQLDSVSKQLAEAKTAGDASNVSFLQSKAGYLRERIAALQTKVSDPDLKAKEEALAPIVSDLWDFQRVWLADLVASDSGGATGLNAARADLIAAIRQKLDQAATYQEIYRSIGQELWVAERLLASGNSAHRRVGVSLALQASQSAQDDAQNGWLAGRICEGYVWPHLDVADETNRRSGLSLENVLNQCADIFRRNDEWQNVSRTYEWLLAKANNSPRADFARAQIAMAHEQAGDPEGALRYLRSISATNDFAWALRRVPRLERQIKAK